MRVSLTLYRVFLLSPHRVWQLLHIENLHPLGHPMTAVVPRAVIKETPCMYTYVTVIIKVQFFLKIKLSPPLHVE